MPRKAKAQPHPEGRQGSVNSELIVGYQREWETERNPLAVWRALNETLASEAPLPDFVLDYLDGVGWAILERWLLARVRTERQ
jgi:hypothetical protein